MEHVVVMQLFRLSERGLTRVHEARAEGVLRLGQLLVRDARGANAVQLGGDEGVELERVHALVGDREDEQHAGPTSGIEGVHDYLSAEGRFLPPHHCHVQTRALPLAEDDVQQLEGTRVRVRMRRRAIDPQHRRQVGVHVGHLTPLDARGKAGGAAHGGGLGVARDLAEILIHVAPQLQRPEVAHHDERGVVGGVIGVEEGPDVGELCRVEVVHRSDDRVRVGEARRAVERPGHAVDERGRVRLVVDPQPALFLYGLALVVEVLVRDGERPHPIGLKPERQVQAIRGHRFIVVRAVFRRAAVFRSAGPRDQLELLALLHVGRALEHHVLEQVREARAARPLVTRAGVVPHVHRHDGRRVIFRVKDAQAVGKRERFVRDLAGLPEQRGSERRAEEQQSCDHGRDAHTTAHSGVGTTGPDRTSSNKKPPSRVSPFTTRRGPVRVA